MNPILKWLGISPEVQAFFHADDLRFDYGGVREIYAKGFHYVPTTPHLRLAGSSYGAEVIVTHSVMEAIAWYALHNHRYRDPSSLALVSMGNLPATEQIEWLRKNFKCRKFTLVFGNDLLGMLTDIRVACALKGKSIRLIRQKTKIEIILNGRSMLFEDEHCSLHRLEKIFGVRTGVRTSKPLQYVTFLNQLQKGASQSPYPQIRV